MTQRMDNGYYVNLEENSITTQAGFKMDKEVLTNVGSMYDNLKVTNIILGKYEDKLTHAEAWNLACEITKNEEVLENYVLSKVEDYLMNKENETELER